MEKNERVSGQKMKEREHRVKDNTRQSQGGRGADIKREGGRGMERGREREGGGERKGERKREGEQE